jgi:hypothetical protein
MWLIRGQRPQQRQETPPEDPQEILERRLGAGEITIEE